MTPAQISVARAANGAAAVVSIVALTCLAGWALDLRALTSLGLGMQSMKPLTAVGLLLVAAAAILLRSHRLRVAATPLGALTALIGAAALVEWVTGLRLGISTLLFRSAVIADAPVAPGRPAVATCLGLLFLGLAVIALATLRRPVSGHMLAIVAMTIALIAILGTAYGVQSLYGISVTTSIAGHTSLSIVLVGFALVVVDAKRGLSGVFVDDTAGGRLARRLLPVTAVVPLAIGWISLRGDDAGLYDAKFAVSLIVGLVIVSMGAMIWASANRVSRIDRQRLAAAEALRELRASLDAHAAAVAREVGHAQSLEDALQTILDAAVRVAKVERVVYSGVEGGAKLRLLAAAGPEGLGERTGAVIDIGGTAMLADLQEGRTHRSVDATASRENAIDALAVRTGVASYVVVPEFARGALHSTLGFSARVPHGYDDDAARFFETLSRNASGPLNTLRNLRLEQETTRRLRELDALKNDFVGMVAHDLRSPMTIVRGFADILTERWSMLDDVQRLEMVVLIRAGMSRLSNLVSDILEVARIESGSLEYHLAPTDLVELARRTLDEQRLIYPDRTFVLRAGEDLPPAIADPERSWRVLTNLLSNAQRFSPAGAPIDVALRREGETIEVAVTDTGPGIAAEDVPRLFQRFSRIASDVKSSESTGLGLFICKSLVEGQGGRIWVDSESGVRTTFTFALPIQEAAL